MSNLSVSNCNQKNSDTHNELKSNTLVLDNPKQFFTKHLDVTTGKFYHVIKATNERTWDKPKGDNVPLELNNQEQEVRFEKTNNLRKILSEQRRYVIQKKKAQYQEQQSKKQIEKQQDQERIVKEAWLLECRKGVMNKGILQVNWKNFGYISHEIYDFERNNPSIELWDLSLNGNGLDSIHDLPIHCINLQRLSLACNQIRKLDDSVGKLISLTHLNLLRNGLEYLPSSIESLTQLKILDVSHNSLASIPDSIQNLNQIKVLNLECNQLKEIPRVIGNMSCETINVNSNEIVSLPHTIGQMKALKRLSANDNRLKLLPVELFDSKTLEVLHVSRNNITELPSAIGNLSSTLERLWLDNNKLSALPSNFHLLTRLKELQLEGNSTMVNPSMSTIVKGPKEVLKWCQLNLARCDHARKRNIVVAMQDVLEQVARLKFGGLNPIKEPHESVFESDVKFNGGKYIHSMTWEEKWSMRYLTIYKELHYQFLMPIFWESFVPQMEKFWSKSSSNQLKGMTNSFPFERWEVEQTLFQFQDAAGKLIHYQKKSKFKKCSCMYNNGKMLECISKNKIYCCQRPALLLRKNIFLENIMIEKRRKQNEEKRINDAVKAAKKIALQYLHSNEGREEVRSIAEKVVEERMEEKKAVIDLSTSEKPKSTTIDDFTPIKKNTNMISIVMDYLPWRKRTEREVEEAMRYIRSDFISKEIKSRKAKTAETNRKLKTVLDAWLGLTVEDVFRAWKSIVVQLKLQRIKDDNKRKIKKERQYLEEREKQIMAVNELQLWEQRYDNFNDRSFWEHSLTKEIKWEEPTVDFIIENASWSFAPTKPEQSSEAIGLNCNRINGAMEKENLIAATNILKRRKDLLKKKKSVS